MVKSIIDIDVNDAKFKAFLELYAKYQESLKDNPKFWEKANSETEKMGKGLESMAGTLHANASIEKQIEAEKAKARKKDSDAAKAGEKAEKKRLDDQKKALAVTTKIASEIGKTTVNLLKWASIGALAEIGTDFLGFWGLKDFASGIGKARTTAMGLNLSVGEQRAMQINFGRYGDTDSALQKTMSASQNPDSWWAFNQLGINTNGKDTAQLMLEAQSKVMQLSQKIPNNVLGIMSQSYGWDKLFDPNQIQALKTAGSTPQGRAEYNTQLKHYELDKKQLQVEDGMSRKWQDFVATLERGTSKLRVNFIDKLTAIEPQLEHFAAKMLEIGSTLLDHLDLTKLDPLLDKFAGWADNFGKYLGSPKFVQDVQNFNAAFSALLSWTVEKLRFFGILPDPRAAPDSPSPGDPGVKSPGYKLTSKGLTQAEGAYYKFFRGQGLSINQAAAYAVNLGDEGGNNPFAQGDFVKGKGFTAYGLGQWHKDRQGEYTKAFGHTMQSVRDPAKALQEQLQFVLYERSHREWLSNQLVAMADNGDPFAARMVGEGVSRYYFRPGLTTAQKDAEAMRRGLQTQQFVKLQVTDNRTDTSVAATNASK